MNTKIRKLVTASLMAAITCVLTFIIKVPMPLDCAVILCGWLLGPLYGALAAGIGSAVADLIAGFATYAPATFVIKALVAIVSYYIFKSLKKIKFELLSRVISGIVAEIIMVAGYFVYEATVMGYGMAALSGVVGNSVQAGVGVVLATAFIVAAMKNKSLSNLLYGKTAYKE